MNKTAKIYYFTLTDEMLREEKLRWFANTRFQDIPFQQIIPDKNYNWLNIADNDFEELLPLINKKTKLAKSQQEEQAVFKLSSLGIITARDEWVYDFNQPNLRKKVNFFCDVYQQEQIRWQQSEQNLPINHFVDRTLKWTSELEVSLAKNVTLNYKPSCVKQALYRPYVKKYLYFDEIIIHRSYLLHSILRIDKQLDNQLICINVGNQSFNLLATNCIADYHLNGDAICIPINRYSAKGKRLENITDWGLNQFRVHYQNNNITKENIFHYTYAVLHNPTYRQKYTLNLKREFPRLPFYQNFSQWVTWGKQLMDLHLNYETVKKYPLKRIDKKLASHKTNPPKLKANKEAGKIQLDVTTSLQGVPPKAWEYKLGNRSALEWILDQYKEKTLRDKTIAEKFNTYRFADYKETVIELLQRVCTVSVETMRIIREMP